MLRKCYLSPHHTYIQSYEDCLMVCNKLNRMCLFYRNHYALKESCRGIAI